jgi:hypothetical protein
MISQESEHTALSHQMTDKSSSVKKPLAHALHTLHRKILQHPDPDMHRNLPLFSGLLDRHRTSRLAFVREWGAEYMAYATVDGLFHIGDLAQRVGVTLETLRACRGSRLRQLR